MGRREYLRAIFTRYHRSAAEQKGTILDEFCKVCGYNRKYAIRLRNGPPPEARPRPPATFACARPSPRLPAPSRPVPGDDGRPQANSRSTWRSRESGSPTTLE